MEPATAEPASTTVSRIRVVFTALEAIDRRRKAEGDPNIGHEAEVALIDQQLNELEFLAGLDEDGGCKRCKWPGIDCTRGRR